MNGIGRKLNAGTREQSNLIQILARRIRDTELISKRSDVLMKPSKKGNLPRSSILYRLSPPRMLAILFTTRAITTPQLSGTAKALSWIQNSTGLIFGSDRHTFRRDY